MSSHVVLDLEPGEPIRGSIRIAGEAPAPFHGWLELVSQLERVHAATRTPEGSGFPPRA